MTTDREVYGYSDRLPIRDLGELATTITQAEAEFREMGFVIVDDTIASGLAHRLKDRLVDVQPLGGADGRHIRMTDCGERGSLMVDDEPAKPETWAEFLMSRGFEGAEELPF